MARVGRGDKERAIQLLQHTDMSVREISKVTGVPQGTLTNGSYDQYRPKHVKERNAMKSNFYTAREKKEVHTNIVLPSSTDFNEESETTAGVVMGYDTETNVKGKPFNFNFSINAEETNVSKGVAVMRLKEAMELLNSLPVEEVSLNVTIK